MSALQQSHYTTTANHRGACALHLFAWAPLQATHRHDHVSVAWQRVYASRLKRRVEERHAKSLLLLVRCFTISKNRSKEGVV